MNQFPFYFSWSAQKNVQFLEIEKAVGHYVHTKNQTILDMTSTSYQCSFGFSETSIIQKMKDQLDTLPMASPKSVFPLKTNSSEKLLLLLGLKGKIFYTTSGAESIENALKMARKITGRKKILARSVSYHGATLGALSVTGDWRNQSDLTADQWTIRIPEPQDDPTLEKTRKIILENDPSDIAAFCLETITGNNGVIIAPQSWWDGIQKLATEFKIKIILDEVICGFYRTGKAFGFQHYKINADFIAMAKNITGGYIPFGAVWTSEAIADYYETNILSCGLTNYAHPIGLAAMNAVLDLINTDSFRSHLSELISKNQIYIEKLKTLENVIEVRTIGLMTCIIVKKPVPWKNFIDNNIYLVSQNERILVCPALNMSFSDLEIGMKKIIEVISLVQ